MKSSLLTDHLRQYKIVLASGSPRRRHLLSEMGLSFNVLTTGVDEIIQFPQDPELSARQIASDKIRVLNNYDEHQLYIAADTVVVKNGAILNKPKDKHEAQVMLNSLSDSEHQVITGVALRSESKTEVFSETTIVTFNPLNNAEIDHYISSYKPFDKAGAYGIQEWIGINFIRKIEGSYFNVVGLPTARLYQEFMRF
jgi:septum formation protein